LVLSTLRRLALLSLHREDESDDAELKLIAYGLACEVTTGKEFLIDKAGTITYMAPETLRNIAQYDSSVDMWALGVVACLLLTGHHPFGHTDEKETALHLRGETARRIRDELPELEGEHWTRVTTRERISAAALLQKKPGNQLNAAAALDHPVSR
jgi:serine/threonine protein kinase